MTVGQAYLDLYEMPTTYFRGVWVPAIVLMIYYVAFTCMTFWSMGRLRFDEVQDNREKCFVQNYDNCTSNENI